ncbi:MAG: LCP family protein [Candidatus Moraniibacteriota bacterium]
MTPLPNHPKGFSLGAANLDGKTRPKRRSRRVFLPLTTFAIALVVLLAGSSLFIGARFTQSLHFENRDLSFFGGLRIISDSFLGTGQTLAGEADGRVNILLLGRAGEKYPGHNLTDTVMLLSLDTEKKRVGLLSLPRDLFAPIPGTGLSTKLNSLYQIGLNDGSGVDILRGSVAEITGLPVHYYAMIDFDGFERMIDALGGIQVEVKRDIYDSRYPGKNYSYETFELKKGWQKLDGKTALKYARERHDDPEGDFGRAKRQQEIMQAVREKVWSIPTFLNPFTLSGFLENLGKSIATDIPPEELGRLIELARVFDTKNISTVVIDAWKKESLLRVSHIESGGVRAFILVPRSGTWDEISDAAEHLFEERDREQRREAIQKESARLVILAPARYRTAAETLAADIRDTYPLDSVKIETTNALDVSGETAIIQDKSGVRVPFTLDSLVGRYGLTIGTIPANTTTFKADTDLVILYPKNDITEFFTLDHSSEIPADDADFQEPLAPQKNPHTR